MESIRGILRGSSNVDHRCVSCDIFGSFYAGHALCRAAQGSRTTDVSWWHKSFGFQGGGSFRGMVGQEWLKRSPRSFPRDPITERQRMMKGCAITSETQGI